VFGAVVMLVAIIVLAETYRQADVGLQGSANPNLVGRDWIASGEK
jgi:hypothetical protein